MEVRLGRTNITVNKNGFGGLPLQRVPEDEAIMLIRNAIEGGVQLIDTARNYTDSEIKIGKALKGIRHKVTLCTKTYALDRAQFDRELDVSMDYLQTDYIDIYQFHNLKFCPKPGDGTMLYEGMEQAKRQGRIGHIGITTHRYEVAVEALRSGLYDTIQFPFCYLASQEDYELVASCKERNIGFIAMKGLSGGLLTNSAAAYAFMAQYDNVLPIWGIQRQSELDEFLAYQVNPPIMDQSIRHIIEADKKELQGEFCRGCGYCLPCEQEIQINIAVRMGWFLKRMPSQNYTTQEWKDKMERISMCTGCGKCISRCPYSLNIPELLHKNYKQYQDFIKRI